MLGLTQESILSIATAKAEEFGKKLYLTVGGLNELMALANNQESEAVATGVIQEAVASLETPEPKIEGKLE